MFSSKTLIYFDWKKYINNLDDIGASKLSGHLYSGSELILKCDVYLWAINETGYKRSCRSVKVF